jgi:SpoIID/LytB domain protein
MVIHTFQSGNSNDAINPSLWLDASRYSTGKSSSLSSIFRLMVQTKTWLSAALVTACWVGLAPKPGLAQSTDPIIDVGIVQRFGAEPTDKLTLQPLSGDRLTLQFKTGDQSQRVATTGQVKVEVTMQPLPQPNVTERIVLSTHRSFESAEDSADRWRSQGVEVEIAQPRQWQVWAKRDTYSTPLLRRLLLQNLRSHGSSTAFIDTQIQQKQPKVAFVVNGYRYQRDEFNIVSGNSRIYVNEGESTRDRRLFAGTLKIQPNAYGTYTLVNQVPIETYLRGVVPHEIGLGAPPNTIEAQAILARTYALRNLRRFAIDNYQLCADTQCQVYRGLTGAAAASDQAIAATRGLVLTYQNELVDALYSSTTGGITAPFGDVWNGPDRPYLKAVVDSVQNLWDLSSRPLSDEANFRAFIAQQSGFNEDGWDMFRWRTESTLTEISNDLREYLRNRQSPLANFTRIEELRVVERSPAGRVVKLEARTDRGTITLEKDEVMRALYAPNSTLFYLEPLYQDAATNKTFEPASPNNTFSKEGIAQAPTAQPTPQPRLRGYAFVGGGLGHGVGMSQTGAYNLGDLGWSSTRILNFYYPGAQVQPLNSSIVFWRDPSSLSGIQSQLEDDRTQPQG